MPTEFDGFLILGNTKEYVPFAPGIRLLDLGTGRGLVVEYFRKQGLDAHGIDRRSVLPLNDYFHKGDLRQMPFPDASFDIVTEHMAFAHMRGLDGDYEGSRQALLETHRVLKPGGHFISVTSCIPKTEIVALDFADVAPKNTAYGKWLVYQKNF